MSVARVVVAKRAGGGGESGCFDARGQSSGAREPSRKRAMACSKRAATAMATVMAMVMGDGDNDGGWLHAEV